MRSFLAVLGLSLLVSCQALSEALGGGEVAEDGTVVLTLPDGSQAVLEAPAGSQDPVEHELPDGTKITLQPQTPTTPLGAVARTVGGLASTLLGVPPPLGGLIASVAATALGALGSRKPKQPSVQPA